MALFPSNAFDYNRLALWFPALVALGIALYFCQNAPLPVWPCFLLLLASGAAIRLSIHHFISRLLAISFFALFLGMVAAAFRLQAVEAPVLKQTLFYQPVTGTVDDIQQKDGKIKLILGDISVATLAPEETPKHVSVSLKSLQVPARIGDKITLPATLFTPPAPAMPGAYDFARMFYFSQLGAVGFSAKQPELLSHSDEKNWQERLIVLRLSIEDKLVSEMGKEDGEVAAAMMVGEQSGVSKEVNDAMRDAGIYHVLSISGLHLALACGIVFYFTRLTLALIPGAALHLPIKKIAASVGLIGGFTYLMLAGYPVPAVRSYIMVASVLIAILCDRKGVSIYSLAWSATFILLFLPESLYTASFQMSYAATIAIVALYESYGALLSGDGGGVVRKTLYYFFGLMITSLAATLYTTPLVIYHFNRFATMGIVSNMLMVPLASFVIMPAAVLVFLLMPFGWEAPASWVLNLGIHWMIVGARFMAAIPYANISMPSLTLSGLILSVIGGLWLAIWTTRIRFLGFAMMALGLATFLFHEPYDFLISDDAKRVAYRMDNGEWAFLRGKTDGFESELWLRTQGKESALSRKEAVDADSSLRCNKESCMLALKTHVVTVGFKKEIARELCQSGADIVISDQWLYPDECRDVPYVIDRAFVEKHGAVGIRIKPHKVMIATTEEARGRWPWSKQALVDVKDQTIITPSTHDNEP